MFQPPDSTNNGNAGRLLQANRKFGAEIGKTPAQIAIAWVIANPAVSVGVMGCDQIADLDENLGALGWRLSDDHLARLNGAGI